MYKGILFLYDECQSENNGFFCAKSGICDLVKKSRDFSAGKSGSKGGPSVAQSPIRSSEQEDDSQNPSRKSRSNNRGPFSVGQTLRICKGQLKGYLCRVIRIYRADITVKLDSLGKLLTVDEKLLSLPNSRRDDATALQSDMFENQEDQSTGGLMNEGGGFGMDQGDLNAGISSFGRDSWNAPSSSSFSFPTNHDGKDETQGADPWGTKLSSVNGDQEQKAANSWGKAPSTVAENSWNKTGAEAANSWGKAPGTIAENSWNKTGAEKDAAENSWNKTGAEAANSWGKASGAVAENSWNKTGAQKDAADAWNKPSSKAETSTDGWRNDNTSKKTDQNSSMEGASDGWAGVVSAPVESQTLGEDGWGKTASKGPAVSNTETGGWGKTKVPSSDTGGSWNTKDSSEKGKSEGFGRQSGILASPNSGGGDNRGSWNIQGKGIVGTNDDIWGKSAASQEKSTDGNQAAGWVSLAPSVEQVGAAEKAGWGKAIGGNQTAGWGSSATNVSSSLSFEAGSQSNSWDKAKTPSSSSGLGKSNETAGWGASAVNSAKPTIELDTQTSSWDKVSIPSSSSGWQKSNQADTTVKEGWKKDGFSSGGQIDGWNKEKTFDRDQSSGWNKAGNTEGGKDGSMDGWNKVKSSEGQGFGQESQREWKRGDASSKDSAWGQGSGWSQGNSNNENGKNWNQQRDFDGGRGSSRGRGRGRFEGRGGRNEDGDSGGGWRSGRGGGRGRNGGGGYNRDGSDAREFGRGRGRGRGREQGQGHFESSDWRNKQESSGDGGFSSNPSSSWGGAGVCSWAKNKDEHSTGATNENAGWNSKKSYGGAPVPGWGSDSQDAGESKKDMNADHSSSWSKVASTGKPIDDWNKDDKNDNWINKTSSLNQMSAATEGDSKWNTSIATSSQPSGWKKNEIKGINTSNASEVSVADRDTSSVKLNANDWSQTSSMNKEKEAADSQGGWNGQNVSAQLTNPSSGNENNWGNSKGDGSGNPVSSKGWGGNNLDNMDSGSTAWEARKEPSSQSTWAGVGKDSSGNKSSDWNNGGSKWNKQSEGQGNSESWGHGSDGRGGGRGRFNSFSGGRSDFGRGGGRGGRDNSFSGRGGGRGRDNSFSGRGRGRNSEGRFSWNGGSDGSVQEGNGEKRSWKSEGGNQPAGWAKQSSGWASASAPVSNVESGKSSWESRAEPSSNMMTSGWESASAKEPVPSNVRTSGWASGYGSGVEPQNDPQDKMKLPAEENTGNDKLDGGWAAVKSDKPGSWGGKTSVSTAATDSNGQNAAWGGGPSKTNQVGGWESTDIPSEKSTGNNNKLKGSWEDGNSSKSGSWDVLGPGSKITADFAAGSNDTACGPDDSRGRDQNNPWGKAASSSGNSGHRGGNAGW
ncbi:hypothetical protein KSP39_PZI021943 [Platanthera zijinensis]|uniref:Protein RNA-directed DNA methylation 3 n=1 Tax=Platanthera zijinensis TaxID=2320716 RepID=A0AAP0AYD7_9ASPA